MIFNMYTQSVSRIPCDTFLCVKRLARSSIFIHADILVLVHEFVEVGILSSVSGGGRCQPL